MLAYDQYFVAISTTVVCIFGFAFNGFALFLLVRLPELKNSFGYMCTSHIFADLGLMCCFLFWGVPMTLTKSVLSASDLGKMVAGISILFWEVSIYSHVFVALNRFCAIYMPIRYTHIFTKSTTFTLIVVSWILAIAHVSPFIIPGCGIHYTTDSYLWLYDETACSQWIATWMDFYLSCFWIIIIAILDVLNLIRIVSMWRNLSTATVTGKRKHREIMFFAQAFCQNILFAICNFGFHWAGFWFSDPIAVFLVNTLFWGFIHAADGFILLAFNIGTHKRKVVANLNELFGGNARVASASHHSGILTPKKPSEPDTTTIAQISQYVK
uniref:G-protein coupled receptors family 1 profile domain-containing protein n=1 Tax=Panagrolaimus davidi TaxID=227884 RepID=A0A914QLG0_9BILA